VGSGKGVVYSEDNYFFIELIFTCLMVLGFNC